MSRTMIVFPMHVAILMDVTAIELGVRYAWIHTRSAGRLLPIKRDAFTSEDLHPDTNAAALALKARQLAQYPQRGQA